jgi:pimeloyl-ACP methyl ester carboxylesterase
MARRILLLLTALLLAAPSAGQAMPDPAVAHANAHRNGPISYHEGWFGTGDKRLHYVEAGQGPLVVLYHGFPSNWFSWFDLMEVLKSRYRVVAVDALGAGLSDKPGRLEPYRIDRLARQLDRLARHLNRDRRFILVGHDWGGALSLAYAQAYPRRLHAVVGMSAPPYNLFLDLVMESAEQRQRSAYMQRLRSQSLADLRSSGLASRIAAQVYGGLRDKGSLSAEEAALFERSVGNVDALNGGVNWYRANVPDFADLGSAGRWPRHNRPITVPTLIVWGDDDQTFLPEFLDRMQGYARNLQVFHQSGVGHMTPIEGSRESSARIAEFIDGLCRQPDPAGCR